MKLIELKAHIEKFPAGHVFGYELSKPFSWRGSYDEVAFALHNRQSTREDILSKIEETYTQEFYGYKGGKYTYGDYTNVNFEYGASSYTDGEYCAARIAEIENSQPVYSNEHRLVLLAFA